MLIPFSFFPSQHDSLLSLLSGQTFRFVCSFRFCFRCCCYSFFLKPMFGTQNGRPYSAFLHCYQSGRDVHHGWSLPVLFVRSKKPRKQNHIATALIQQRQGNSVTLIISARLREKKFDEFSVSLSLSLRVCAVLTKIAMVLSRVAGCRYIDLIRSDSAHSPIQHCHNVGFHYYYY